jgi:hypothetical protein
MLKGMKSSVDELGKALLTINTVVLERKGIDLSKTALKKVAVFFGKETK